MGLSLGLISQTLAQTPNELEHSASSGRKVFTTYSFVLVHLHPAQNLIFKSYSNSENSLCFRVLGGSEMV
jgi:hypothetical protein